MGYTTRAGTSITDFWPDNTDTVIYLTSPTPIENILETIRTTWPDADISDFEISSELIHTYCLYYDRFDRGDWTEFVIITKTK